LFCFFFLGAPLQGFALDRPFSRSIIALFNSTFEVNGRKLNVLLKNNKTYFFRLESFRLYSMFGYTILFFIPGLLTLVFSVGAALLILLRRIRRVEGDKKITTEKK